MQTFTHPRTFRQARFNSGRRPALPPGLVPRRENHQWRDTAGLQRHWRDQIRHAPFV